MLPDFAKAIQAQRSLAVSTLAQSTEVPGLAVLPVLLVVQFPTVFRIQRFLQAEAHSLVTPTQMVQLSPTLFHLRANLSIRTRPALAQDLFGTTQLVVP